MEPVQMFEAKAGIVVRSILSIVLVAAYIAFVGLELDAALLEKAMFLVLGYQFGKDGVPAIMGILK